MVWLYFLLSVFGHIIIALIIKTKGNLIAVLEERKLFLIVLIGIVITSIILYGTTNVFCRFEIPKEYFIIINK